MKERFFSLQTELWHPYGESGVANVYQGFEGDKGYFTNNPDYPRPDMAITGS